MNRARKRPIRIVSGLAGRLSLALFMLLSAQSIMVTGIKCYDCHSDQGTCNEGECEGQVCIKMETSNMDNEKRTVQKGCGPETEESACQQSGLGSKWMTRCVCAADLCNGDTALVEAGLEEGGALSSKSLSTAAIALIAIGVFAAASCSFLLISTICVQACS